MTGVFTSLRPGGFGFIASDAHTTPWKVIFHRAVRVAPFDSAGTGIAAQP